MNKKLQNGKLRRLKLHLTNTFAFSDKDIMKILRVQQQTAARYRNILLREGYIDVSHGSRKEVFFKLTRKNNEDQATTSAV